MAIDIRHHPLSVAPLSLALAPAAAAAADATTTTPFATDDCATVHHSPVASALSSRLVAATSSKDRLYQRLVLSMVAFALLFGAGFGLGMRYSKSRCGCSNSNDGISSSSSSSKTADSSLTIEACQELLQIGQGDAGNVSDSATFTEPPLPPIINPSLDSSTATPAPPFVPPWSNDESERVVCVDHDIAAAELRNALLYDAHFYIHTFAYYIRHGGTGTLFAEFPNGATNSMIAAAAAATQTSAAAAFASASSSSNSSIGTKRQSPISRQRRLEYSALAAAVDTTAHSRRPTNRTRRQSSLLSLDRTHRPQRRLQVSEMPVLFGQGDASGSNNSNSSSNSVRVADIVQTNGDYVFLLYGDEIVVIHAATNAVRRRLAVPKVYGYSTDRITHDLLLVTGNGNGDADPSDDLLVVFVAEYHYERSSLSSNTTVLVYNANMNSDEGGTILARHSLPGITKGAFAIGSDIHIVTRRFLDLSPLWDYLTPATLQNNGTIYPRDSAQNQPRLLLNETQYLDLAFQQLDLYFEAHVTEMLTHLDCTGYVSLLDRPGRNATNTGGDDMKSLVNIASFDMSRSSKLLTQSSTMSFLPASPASHDWKMLLADTNLVLACALWSGAQLTNTSQPMTWLVAFSFSNASAALSSTGIVPGALREPSHLNMYHKNGRDYLRIVTARYNNLVEYQESQFLDDPTPSRAQVSVLALMASTSSNSSNVYAMPMVGEVSDFGSLGANSTVMSTLFEDNAMYIVVHSASGNETKSILSTIDTADPNDPRLVVGQTELDAYSSFYLYRVDVNLILGVGDLYLKQYSEADDRFRIVLLNMSRHLDASSIPILVDQWQPNDVLSRTNGTHTEVMHPVAELYSDEAPRYIADLNTLVVAGWSEHYVDGPCPGNVHYARDENQNLNSSEVQDIIDKPTCQFEQSTLFNGFWIFKIDTGSSLHDGNRSSYITKHFEIDHASSDLVRESCVSEVEMPSRDLAFDGDVMTIKGGSVQSHDVLTKIEAAPTVLLSTDCLR